MRRYAAVFLLCIVAACGGSTAQPSVGPHSSPVAGYLGSLGNASCSPSANFHGWHAADGFPETGLDAKGGSVWALFFAPVPPTAGKEIKVVWRMTGTGAFVFRASDADRRVVPLAWGPQGHLSSDWTHPGDEVGTGFNFPHAGCWNIHVARSDVSADLWLKVVA
ncbi:MAG TPA: hypothetical protein VG426_10015 [Candidatus Dormibacteraeota bacterium]|nr:hypothetical protein [Candidatus Dormibacteraeota bacterium]